MTDDTFKNLPDHIPVTVIMEKQPAVSSKWVDHIWVAIGVTVTNIEQGNTDEGNTEEGNTEQVSDITDIEDDAQLKKYTGHQVRLYIDECDSYYHNLMSPTPHCFVVVRQDDDDDEPEPFIVSLSFDEAHAYLEGDDEVFAVDIPPEIYQWTESFVLEHYCPEQFKKRKRKDWNKESQAQAQVR